MTPNQRKMARHALGLDGERSRSFRNRYFVSLDSPSEAEWIRLCRCGLAERMSDDGRLVGFALSAAGAREALNIGESLDHEDFPDDVSGVVTTERNDG